MYHRAQNSNNFLSINITVYVQSSPFLRTLDRMWFKRVQGCISQSWRWKLRHTIGRVAVVDALLQSKWGSGVYGGDTKDWGRAAETQLRMSYMWKVETREKEANNSKQCTENYIIKTFNKMSSKGKEMLYSSFEATMQQNTDLPMRMKWGRCMLRKCRQPTLVWSHTVWAW